MIAMRFAFSATAAHYVADVRSDFAAARRLVRELRESGVVLSLDDELSLVVTGRRLTMREASAIEDHGPAAAVLLVQERGAALEPVSPRTEPGDQRERIDGRLCAAGDEDERERRRGR